MAYKGQTAPGLHGSCVHHFVHISSADSIKEQMAGIADRFNSATNQSTKKWTCFLLLNNLKKKTTWILKVQLLSWITTKIVVGAKNTITHDVASIIFTFPWLLHCLRCLKEEFLFIYQKKNISLVSMVRLTAPLQTHIWQHVGFSTFSHQFLTLLSSLQQKSQAQAYP